MSSQSVHTDTSREPHGWRETGVRIAANAVLVLLAFEAVSYAAAVAGTLVGRNGSPTPAEWVPALAIFLLFRWVFVLPGLLPVLAVIDLLARRVRRARVMAGTIAFAPMIAWELTQSTGRFPSEQGVVLGVTALVFAAILRLPEGRGDRRATPVEPALAPD